jgi:HEAT repeat protein
VIDDGEAYLGLIKGCLNDPYVGIRLVAVEGIGLKTNHADSAIPLLLAALEDQDPRVSSRAAEMLENFGTNALRAFGTLTNVVQSGRPKTASAALGTLIKIAPGETLPIVLERFHSADVTRRRQALVLLCKYPLKAPEIQAAIEEAAADTNAEVSLKAKEFISEQQREQRGKAH